VKGGYPASFFTPSYAAPTYKPASQYCPKDKQYYSWSGATCYLMKSKPVFAGAGYFSYCGNQGLPNGTEVWENGCNPTAMRQANKKNQAIGLSCMKSKISTYDSRDQFSDYSVCSDKDYGLVKLQQAGGGCLATTGKLNPDGTKCIQAEVRLRDRSITCTGVGFSRGKIFIRVNTDGSEENIGEYR